MKLSTNNKVAFGHLTSRPKQVIVAMLSVTFGISMYIFMNSFMTGVNDMQTELAFSALSHIRIYNDLPEDRSNLVERVAQEHQVVHIRNPKVIRYTEGIRNCEKFIQVLRNQPEAIAVSPQVNVNVFFRNGATRINGVLAGIDAEGEERLFKISEYMLEGKWHQLEYRNDGIIMGSGLALRLGLTLNDQVSLSTSDGITKNYEIIGIFETTIATLDNTKAYIKISSARQLISENQGYATDILANIEDFEQARQVAQRIRPVIPYEVESWSEANGQLESASTLRNIIAIAISLTILLVAGFGIYNIMNMTVNEKIRDIAILKAMGFAGRDIVQIFLTQSLIIGFVGGILGLLLGFVIAYTTDHTPFDIGVLDSLPMAYRSQDYGLAFMFGIITSFIAGYLPSYKASTIDPVSILRG